MDCIDRDFQLSDHLIIDSDGRLIIQCNHGHTHSTPQRYTMEYHPENAPKKGFKFDFRKSKATSSLPMLVPLHSSMEPTQLTFNSISQNDHCLQMFERDSQMISQRNEEEPIMRDAPEEPVTVRNQAVDTEDRTDSEAHPVITQTSPVSISIELLAIQRMEICSGDDSLVPPQGHNLDSLTPGASVELPIEEISEEISFPRPSLPSLRPEESTWIEEVVHLPPFDREDPVIFQDSSNVAPVTDELTVTIITPTEPESDSSMNPHENIDELSTQPIKSASPRSGSPDEMETSIPPADDAPLADPPIPPIPTEDQMESEGTISIASGDHNKTFLGELSLAGRNLTVEDAEETRVTYRTSEGVEEIHPVVDQTEREPCEKDEISVESPGQERQKDVEVDIHESIRNLTEDDIAHLEEPSDVPDHHIASPDVNHHVTSDHPHLDQLDQLDHAHLDPPPTPTIDCNPTLSPAPPIDPTPSTSHDTLMERNGGEEVEREEDTCRVTVEELTDSPLVTVEERNGGSVASEMIEEDLSFLVHYGEEEKRETSPKRLKRKPESLLPLPVPRVRRPLPNPLGDLYKVFMRAAVPVAMTSRQAEPVICKWREWKRRKMY
ncbi:hypothetical protein PROFUN_05880 [Planoprotostelium fungivorum]|uniref:Uncharacterized protein n=1 Tax=Planoprotostelium fungivorum TaxID=1890364 RepID=A0A2P6NKP8_9EUKA|nr:hypothetical protein PROFUN_05880 [Planoprotostelium fungivorum]